MYATKSCNKSQLLCGVYNYDSTSIRRPFDERAFDCLSKVIKVSSDVNPLTAVTLTYIFI